MNNTRIPFMTALLLGALGPVFRTLKVTPNENNIEVNVGVTLFPITVPSEVPGFQDVDRWKITIGKDPSGAFAKSWGVIECGVEITEKGPLTDLAAINEVGTALASNLIEFGIEGALADMASRNEEIQHDAELELAATAASTEYEPPAGYEPPNNYVPGLGCRVI